MQLDKNTENKLEIITTTYKTGNSYIK